MKSAITRSNRANDDYFDMVRKFPLRRLRSDAKQEEAVRILSGLVGREQARISAGQREYADALGCLIREYDARVYPLPGHKITPLELVKSLMDDHGMNIADLGRILGSATAASFFLSGKRELSKSHIRRLSEHFKMNAGAFL